MTFADPVKDNDNSASEPEDKESKQRTVITAEPTSSTTSPARPAGPTREQPNSRFDVDDRRGPTAAPAWSTAPVVVLQMPPNVELGRRH